MRRLILISFLLLLVCSTSFADTFTVKDAIEDLVPEISQEIELIHGPRGASRRFIATITFSQLKQRVIDAYSRKQKLSGGLIVSGYSTDRHGVFSFTFRSVTGAIIATIKAKKNPSGVQLDLYPSPNRKNYIPFRFFSPMPKTKFYPLP